MTGANYTGAALLQGRNWLTANEQATLARAQRLNPAAILTTCSMYTQHLPTARKQISTPIVGIDEAMIQRALNQLEARMHLPCPHRLAQRHRK